MSAVRSFRSRLWVGSVLWTLGVLLVVSVLLVTFLATHPQPHMVILGWLLAVPAVVLLCVGGVCMAVGAQQIRRGLSAVDELRGHLLAVHQGHARYVSGVYPAEVQPLVDDLNALLADRERRVSRAVSTAADLAHGLKTPLAVLSGDADRAAAAGNRELSASLIVEIDRMRRQVDYHLAAARASASAHTPNVACRLAPTVDGLVRALARLHADRELQFSATVPASTAVRCSREDVEEMLGNLLDNACKWGRRRVCLDASATTGGIVVTVDDDGPGLDPALAEAVLGRGIRADQRVPGSGLGLAIVQQVADVYGGSIALGRSPIGGVRAQLTLPTASSP